MKALKMLMWGVVFSALMLGIGFAATASKINQVIREHRTDRNSVMQYTQVHAEDWAKRGLQFNYIYSPEMVYSDNILAKIGAAIPAIASLFPAVSGEIKAALFNYYYDGGRVAGQGIGNLNVNSAADWANVYQTVTNTAIVPGRNAAIYGVDQSGGKHKVRSEAELENYQTSQLYSVLTSSSASGKYVYIDGVLTYLVDKYYTYDNVDLKSVSVFKYVSPLVLDLLGNGQLEASNGEYKPHGTFDEKSSVVADFYGDGFEIAMEWVGPNDGLLVAPKADGTVDMSCLFGTAGGYDSGYEKLSLYADKNGIVKGSALNALAVWQDANRNAIADKGEVRSCSELGITSINTNDVQFVSSFEMNGKKHKMWDWWPNAVELRTIATK